MKNYFKQIEGKLKDKIKFESLGIEEISFFKFWSFINDNLPELIISFRTPSFGT